MNNQEYKFLALDEHGYLINPTSPTNIQAPWIDPANELVAAFQSVFGDQLISVYVDGSVARGEAVEDKSDIDCVGIVTHATKEKRIELGKHIDEITTRYSFVTKIDCGAYTLEELKQNNPHELMILKTLATSVWGQDLSSELPDYKPNLALAQMLQKNVRKIFERGKLLISESGGKRLQALCVWMMKRFVRTGFYICMPKIKQNSVDTQTQLKVFCDYYPEHTQEMQQAFEWIKNPTDDRQQLLNFIGTFGEWLISEAEKELQLPCNK